MVPKDSRLQKFSSSSAFQRLQKALATYWFGRFWQIILLVWQLRSAIVILLKYNLCPIEMRRIMKKINWYPYIQMLRQGFDLARIFPIISKQRAISELISGISSQIMDASYSFFFSVIQFDLNIRNLVYGFFPNKIFGMAFWNIHSFRLHSIFLSWFT